MSEYVQLTSVAQRCLAAPLVAFLADQGIEARVSSDDCGGVDPALAFALGVGIQVPAEDLEAAETALAEFDNAMKVVPAPEDLPEELRDAD